MSSYYKDDAKYETDLEAAYNTVGLPEWWQDTEESDIKLVALYRAKLIEKLEADLENTSKALEIQYRKAGRKTSNLSIFSSW